MGGLEILIYGPDSTVPTEIPKLPKEKISLDICVIVEQGLRQMVGRGRLDLPDSSPYPRACEQRDSIIRNLGASGSLLRSQRVILEGIGDQVSRRIANAISFDQAVKELRNGQFTYATFESTYSRTSQPPKTVRRRLLNALIEAKVQDPEHRWFIPAHVLRNILSEQNITELFREIDKLEASTTDHKQISKISRDGFKLLATVLLADIKPFGFLLRQFWEHDIYDAALPFNVSDDHRPFFCSPLQYDHICTFQWQTMAVELEGAKPSDLNTVHHYNAQWIIPFVEKHKVGSGGFGDVYKVKLAPSHQKIYELPSVGASSTPGIDL